MSYTQSTWSNPGSWTAACDNFKTLFTMTGVSCASDSGTGDSRILHFTFPGSSHRLKISYSSTSNARLDVLKADNSTVMWAMGTSFPWTTTMSVHKTENAGMGCIILNAATNPLRVMWDTYNSAASTRLIVGYGAYTYGIPESIDTYLVVDAFSYSATYTYKTTSGYQILIPLIVASDVSSVLMDFPLDHSYKFANADTIAPATPVTINGVVYLHFISGVLLKTA